MTEREVESRESVVADIDWWLGMSEFDLDVQGAKNLLRRIREQLLTTPDQARAEGRAEALAEVVAKLEAKLNSEHNLSPDKRIGDGSTGTLEWAIATVREMGEK